MNKLFGFESDIVFGDFQLLMTLHMQLQLTKVNVLENIDKMQCMSTLFFE